MSDRFHFHCLAWRSLNGHVWLDQVAVEGHKSPEDVLVAKPAAQPGFPRDQIKEETYLPHERESALFKILAAVEVEKQAIQQFADTYGLLTFDAYSVTATHEGDEFRTFGDPFFEWHYNILALRHWTKVWELVCENDAGGLLEYVRWLPTWAKEERRRHHGDPVGEFIVNTLSILRSTPRDRIKTAKSALRLGIWESHLRQGLTLHLNYDAPHDLMSFRLRGEHLVTAIWAQFASAVVDSKEYRHCDTCGKPFELSPEVARTNRLFCSTPCRLKAYRRRMREAVRMHNRGKALKSIADKLGSDVTTVRGWIKAAKEKR